MNREVRIATAAWVTVILLLGAIVASCSAPSDKAAASAERQLLAPESRGSTRATAAVAPDSPLVDTAWRLLQIQSMDDAIGTVRPDDPSLYTMYLHRDGTVNMRLNCNRAKGTWSAEASADHSSGRFTFGPLAATRVLCLPPSLDERIAAQAEFVRSYLLKDGRLYLSLMADGGIYTWEPHVEESFQTQPDPELEAAILRAVPAYTRKIVDVQGSSGRGRYVYGQVDLNGDGRDEIFVYLLGSIFCGTGGCNLLLFTTSQDGYSLVNDFPISHVPVIVSAHSNRGWKDLFRLESGGGAEASYVRHTFNGKQYVERERLAANTPPNGKNYLTGELTFDRGIPLEPRH